MLNVDVTEQAPEYTTIQVTRRTTAVCPDSTDILGALRSGTLVLQRESGKKIRPADGVAWIDLSDLRRVGVDFSRLKCPLSVLREFPGCPLNDRLQLFSIALNNLANADISNRDDVHRQILDQILSGDVTKDSQVQFLRKAFAFGIDIFDSDFKLFTFKRMQTYRCSPSDIVTVGIFDKKYHADKLGSQLALLDYLDTKPENVRELIYKQMNVRDLNFFYDTKPQDSAQIWRLRSIYSSEAFTVTQLQTMKMPTDSTARDAIRIRAAKAVVIRQSEIDAFHSIIAETSKRQRRS